MITALREEGAERLARILWRALVRRRLAFSVQLVTNCAPKVRSVGNQPPVRPSLLASLEKQVEQGQLNLEDLDSLEIGEGITRGVVAVILGSGNVQDSALRFLAGEKYDAEITNKNANAELALLLNNAYEAHVSAADPPIEMRIALARHVLMTEFESSLGGPAPEQLAAVLSANKPGAQYPFKLLLSKFAYFSI